jgi:acyl-CoA reductase-like NAD-dependent aldehyde dehydrogenase
MTALFKKNKLISLNPADGTVVGEVPLTPPEKVEDVVLSAQQGFEEWSSIPLEKRARILVSAQQLMIERSGPFAETITLEMGRPLSESYGIELEASIDLVGYYAKRARKFLADRRVPLHNIFFIWRGSSVHFQPLGVLGIITPWNWPLLIPLGGIVTALLSGNSVVFKPSELTPLVGEKIREVFVDAGVPPRAFQVVQGDHHVGHALVSSSVAKVFFTGSTAVGQKVMETAAKSLKKVVLEMGGSDPAIVCKDADMEIASSGIVWGGFNNCGQNCNSIERVFVHRDILDRFMDRVIEKAGRLRVGNGMDPDTDIGPMASKSQLEKIDLLVRKAVKDGAEIRCGGEAVRKSKGYFYKPTVLYSDRPLDSFYAEEWFGPVILIVPFGDDEEAVQMANQSSFGLAASVWTRNRRKGRFMARCLETGSVMINDAVVSFGITEAGWTGTKNSGIGWVHGENGLDEMVNIQYINDDPQTGIQKIWWFPYSENVIRAMKAGTVFLFHKNWIRKIRAMPSVLRHFPAYLLFNSKRKGKY